VSRAWGASTTCVDFDYEIVITDKMEPELTECAEQTADFQFRLGEASFSVVEGY
jgi:hypothetical protein